MKRDVYARRLLKLAALLDTIPRHRFDHGAWVGSDWSGDPDLACGTSACALGWATTIPEFRAMGLRLERDPDGDNRRVVLGDIDDPCDLDHAGRTLFGLSQREFDRLFMPGPTVPATASPRRVAREIRQLVAEWERRDARTSPQVPPQHQREDPTMTLLDDANDASDEAEDDEETPESILYDTLLRLHRLHDDDAQRVVRGLAAFSGFSVEDRTIVGPA